MIGQNVEIETEVEIEVVIESKVAAVAVEICGNK
jgi:hypothetical protein